MEIYSLAIAWILFETLIQKGLVKKHNRRTILGTCILIAFKQQQVFGGFQDNEKNQTLFKQLNKDIARLQDKQQNQKITKYELIVLQTLNFHIRPPFFLIVKHIQSILTMLDESLEVILGSKSYHNYIEQYKKYQKARKK